MLAARFNPSIIDVLADHADLARGINDWMSGEALALESRALIHAGVEPGGGIVRELDAAVLLAAPIALQRVVLWRMLAGVGRAGAITFGHVEGARRLLADGGAGDFPAHRAERIAGSLVLTGRPAGTRGRRARPAANLFEYSLSIPGEIVVPDTGVVSVEAAPRAVVSSASGCAAAVRADLCGTTLIVRNRRPGDRFRPAGLAGRKKLQDYFVDRKIARDRRDAVPIVVDEKGRIIWVAGHAIDEAFRVTDPAQPVLLLKFKALGGSA
jgi:tRNA(Ile)-lysidine synthase